MMLTALQVENLKLVAAGSVKRATFGYGAQRIVGGSPTVIGRLVSLGFVEWSNPFGDGPAQLTEAGRNLGEDL